MTHGLSADHRMFCHQVEYYSKDYTVITWDVPMHGESRPYTDFSYPRATEELKTILDGEGIEKIILMGHSMGGYVCQEFAIQHPKYIEAFIAIGTTPFGHCYYSKSDRWWLKNTESIMHMYPHKLLVKSISKASTRTKEAYQNMLEMVSPYEKNELCRLIGIAYSDVFCRSEPNRFDFPVLLVVGKYDKTGKVKQYCRAWAEQEGYPLVWIDAAAHCCHVDNPQAFHQAVDAFLEKV